MNGSVTLLCNPKRPPSYLYFDSWSERVPTTTTLEQQLAEVTSDRDRASVYAQAGLWYDALATLSKVYTKDPSAQNDFLSLLGEVGLTEVVKQERQTPAVVNLILFKMTNRLCKILRFLTLNELMNY